MPSRSRSRSRSRSGGRSRERKHSGGRRDHSRSPMSNRRRHEGNRDDAAPSKCVGVFGLSLYTNERELEAEFKKFGPLEKVQVVLDGHTGRSRGFAFIYFENMEDAKEAKEALNGTEMDSRKIRVDFSITKRAHTPTPGMYMGRPTTGGRSGGGGGYRGGDRRGDRRDDRYRRRSPSPHYRGGRGRSRSPVYRRSPSPHHRRGGGGFRSRSRSFSPRRREYSPRRY